MTMYGCSYFEQIFIDIQTVPRNPDKLVQHKQH